MSITNDDLRAAVGAGLIDEQQAASITQLADERQGYREARSATDEPFELFKGFNEIFIVVGLVILYIGWTAFIGISTFDMAGSGSYAAFIGAVQCIPLVFLTVYFTNKRRMIAPSILLSILIGLSLLTIGLGIATDASFERSNLWALATGITAIGLGIYWYFFRIPFSIMLTSLSFYAMVVSLTLQEDARITSIETFFLLGSQSHVSLITLALGIMAFALAMRFDMSDPHRVTRRSANGFWLNVLAAPAIVNSIALTLYTSASLISLSFLFLFLLLIAGIAIIIDRRSFLISGIGYMIALIFSISDSANGIGFIILLIGALLVLLGANWEKLRTSLMNALPAFVGKEKLPPWNINKGTP